MSWQLSSKIDETLKKGADFGGIDRQEADALMHLDLQSRETYALMQTADQMTREQFGPKGENHFHIGLNVAPCPFNCSFCSLTKSAGIFNENIDFSMDDILKWARLAEDNHADAFKHYDNRHLFFSKPAGIWANVEKNRCRSVGGQYPGY